MKQVFDYDYAIGEASAKFEVDRDILKPDTAIEYLKFFRWEEPYDKDGDPIDELIKKMAMQAIRFATQNSHNLYGVTCDFDEAEGWLPVDGRFGVKLIEVSPYEFRESELEETIKTLEG